MTELTDKQQALLDELLQDFKGDARDLFGEGGLLKTIGKRALEAALEGELTHHLGYPPHDPSGRKSGNSRNGRTAKRLESESGSLDLEVPRDRNGSFEPRIVEKRQRRVAGLDETIVYLYAQGQSTRAIQDTLRRSLRRGGLLYACLGGYRKRSRGSDRMAGSSSGEGVSDRVLRRLVREVSRGGFGEDARGLRGAGDRH